MTTPALAPPVTFEALLSRATSARYALKRTEGTVWASKVRELTPSERFRGYEAVYSWFRLGSTLERAALALERLIAWEEGQRLAEPELTDAQLAERLDTLYEHVAFRRDGHQPGRVAE